MFLRQLFLVKLTKMTMEHFHSCGQHLRKFIRTKESIYICRDANLYFAQHFQQPPNPISKFAFIIVMMKQIIFVSDST